MRSILRASTEHALHPVNDFAYVSTVASIPYLVVVHPSVPVKSVKELIALAKRRPGELMAASAGTGSGTHLAFELFAFWPTLEHRARAVQERNIGDGRSHGRGVQLMLSNSYRFHAHVKSKRLHVLAITTAKRSALYPDIPTVAESGLPGYQADAWSGVRYRHERRQRSCNA